jgi:hypothetical protein
MKETAMRHGIWAVSMVALATLGQGCKSPTVATVFPELLVTLVDGGAFADGGLLFPLTPFSGSSSESFLIQSTSSIDLNVKGFVFDGGDYAIRNDGGLTPPFVLASSTSAVFTVVFTPTPPKPLPDVASITETAGLIIQSDSSTKPDYALPLWGTAAAPRIDLCTTENGSPQCLSGNPNLSVNFPRQPVGSLSSPARIDISDKNDVPLVITAITLDAAALAAGYSIVETNLNLPRIISAATGLTVSFHVILTPTQICILPDGGQNNNCLVGSVSVESSDPHYVAPNLPSVGLIGTGDPDQSPLACIGISTITYVNGTTITLDPTLPLDQQPNGPVFPPGPLDSATFTAFPLPGCSGSPQQLPFSTAFYLDAPDGSVAGFSPNGVPGSGDVLFDLPGPYTATVVVTELPDAGFMGGPNLPTADAGVTLVVVPHDELSVVLNWSSVSPVDMDLHLIRVPSGGGSPPPAISLMVSPDNDCFWCNCYFHQLGLCGPAYSRPTAVDWGQPGYQNTPPDDPLLTSYGYKEEYANPLNEAVTNVGSLEPGTEYDIYVHYFQIQNGADGGCPNGTDAECTDPAYSHCSLLECVPLVHAQIRVFVAGQEVAGSPNVQDVGKICDLWHAGVLNYTSATGCAVDGGPPECYVFVPTPGVTAYYDHNNLPQPGTGTCVLPLQ